MLFIFTQSFCDKYATLYTMAELTKEQIKKLLAEKAKKDKQVSAEAVILK